MYMLITYSLLPQAEFIYLTLTAVWQSREVSVPYPPQVFFVGISCGQTQQAHLSWHFYVPVLQPL